MGKPKLTDVIPAQGVSTRDLLASAIALERLSDHPLAAAVVRDGLIRMDVRHCNPRSPRSAQHHRTWTGRPA